MCGCRRSSVQCQACTFLGNSGPMDMAARIQAGNAVVPVALKVPLDTLTAGDYRIDLRAMDSAGGISAVRSIEFRLD